MKETNCRLGVGGTAGWRAVPLLPLRPELCFCQRDPRGGGLGGRFLPPLIQGPAGLSP